MPSASRPSSISSLPFSTAYDKGHHPRHSLSSKMHPTLKPGVISKFLQLFLLLAMVLVLPSLLYLGRPAHPDSVLRSSTTPSSQGEGAEPRPPLAPIDAHAAQAWKWGSDALAAVGGAAMKPVHKVEDFWSKYGKGQQPQDMAAGSSTAATATTGLAGEGGKVATKPTGVIMEKMVNETAKAELGRATWKFLHTMTLRFPEKPTTSERQTLASFFSNFAQLYPCGDCARHFTLLLQELPPQTSSRMAASLWLCSVHNRVNARLGKPQFPCDKLDETYDCGCGVEAKPTPTVFDTLLGGGPGKPEPTTPNDRMVTVVGKVGRDWTSSRSRVISGWKEDGRP